MTIHKRETSMQPTASNEIEDETHFLEKCITINKGDDNV